MIIFGAVDNEAKVFCLTHFSFIDIPHHIDTANPIQFFLHACFLQIHGVTLWWCLVRVLCQGPYLPTPSNFKWSRTLLFVSWWTIYLKNQPAIWWTDRIYAKIAMLLLYIYIRQNIWIRLMSVITWINFFHDNYKQESTTS